MLNPLKTRLMIVYGRISGEEGSGVVREKTVKIQAHTRTTDTHTHTQDDLLPATYII